MKKITLILIVLTSSGLLFGQAAKKVIIEDETGSWCGYCPGGRTTTEQIEAQYANAIGIANHVGDSYEVPYTLDIDNNFNGGSYAYGYPGGMIDRKLFTGRTSVIQDISTWKSNTANELLATGPVNVTIQSTYNSSTRVVNVTVGANFVGSASGDMRISCVLTEDSVVDTNDPQHNYFCSGCGGTDATSPWYSYPNLMTTYTQRHVARANFAPDFGTTGVIPSSVVSGNSYSQTYNYTIPATYNNNSYATDNIIPNINRMRLVAFVSYYNSDTTKRNILNANVVKLGQSTATGIDENSINVVDVKQNTPNPFKDITAIQFQLNTADNISVKIYNMMGQEINTLVNTQLVPGLHTFYWAGDDNTGNYVRPGIYFYKISTPSQSVSKEMIYMGKQ
jgi:hypothetical protein